MLFSIMAKSIRTPVNPFRYGGLALDEAFADREQEVQELKFDVLNGQDVVIFAPRRYGKSSLVWKAMQQLVADGVLDRLREPDDDSDPGEARREAGGGDLRARRLGARPGARGGAGAVSRACG